MYLFKQSTIDVLNLILLFQNGNKLLTFHAELASSMESQASDNIKKHLAPKKTKTKSAYYKIWAV